MMIRFDNGQARALHIQFTKGHDSFDNRVSRSIIENLREKYLIGFFVNRYHEIHTNFGGKKGSSACIQWSGDDLKNQEIFSLIISFILFSIYVN